MKNSNSILIACVACIIIGVIIEAFGKLYSKENFEKDFITISAPLQAVGFLVAAVTLWLQESVLIAAIAALFGCIETIKTTKAYGIEF